VVRAGDDLTLTVPLAFAEAALGTTLRVPTLDGAVSLKVAPGTPNGRTLRVRGRGVPKKGGHGDLRMPTEFPRNGGQLSFSELNGHAAIVDSVGDLKTRVREQLLQGASQVKLVGGGGVSSPRSPLDMSTFSEDELRAAVDVARDWNTYVTVHAYASNTVQRAIAAGAACIEHAHLMDDATAKIMADKGVWLSTQPFVSRDDVAEQTGPSFDRMNQVFAGTPKVYELVRKHGIKRHGAPTSCSRPP